MKFVTKEDSSTKISKDAVILFKNVNVDTKFVNVDIEQMQNEISKLLEIQEKHLKQIETLYTQLSDKDKLMKKDIIIKITYHVDLVKKTQAISVSCLCFFRKYVIIF